MELRKFSAARASQRALRASLCGKQRRRQLTIEALERRDLLARLVPVVEPVARVSGNHTSYLLMDIPHDGSACGETTVKTFENGPLQQMLAPYLPPRKESSDATNGMLMAWDYRFDPPEPVPSSISQGNLSVDFSDGMFVSSLGTYMQAYDWFDEGWAMFTHQPDFVCNRFDEMSTRGNGSVSLRLEPEDGESFGDFAFVEAFVTSATDRTVLEGPPIPGDPLPPETEITSTVSLKLKEGDTTIWNAECEVDDSHASMVTTTCSYEGIAKIGSIIEMSASFQGFVRSDELRKAGYAWSAINMEAFSFPMEQPTIDLAILDDKETESLLGPYLLGVTFEESFTLTLDELAAAFVEKMTVRLSEGVPGTGNITLSADVTQVEDSFNQWQFSFQLGAFKKDAKLSITIEFADGPPQVVERTVDFLEEKLNLELTMTPGREKDAPSDIDDIRLIEGVPILSATFTPTIKGLEKYEHTLTAYNKLLELTLMASGPNGTTFQPLVLDALTFSKAPLGLNAGDYRLIVRGRERIRDVELSDAEPLLVTKPPEWMTTFQAAPPKFVQDQEIADKLEIPNAAGFKFQFDFPKVANAWRKVVEPDSMWDKFAAILNGHLKTEIDAGITFDAYVSLVHKEVDQKAVAKIVPIQWRVGAVVAGQTLIAPKSGTLIDSGLSGKLDGLSLKLLELRFDKLFNLKQLFDKTTFSYPIGLPGTTGPSAVMPLPVPTCSADMNFAGTLSGALKTLTLNVKIGITEGPNGALQFSASSLELNAEANAKLTTTLKASLACVFGLFKVAQVEGTGTVELDVDGVLKLDIEGEVLSPDIDVAARTGLTVTPSFDFDWDICFFPGENGCEKPPKKKESSGEDEADFDDAFNLDKTPEQIKEKSADVVEAAGETITDAIDPWLLRSPIGRTPLDLQKFRFAREEERIDRYFRSVEEARRIVPIRSGERMEAKRDVAVPNVVERKLMKEKQLAGDDMQDALSAHLPAGKAEISEEVLDAVVADRAWQVKRRELVS